MLAVPASTHREPGTHSFAASTRTTPPRGAGHGGAHRGDHPPPGRHTRPAVAAPGGRGVRDVGLSVPRPPPPPRAGAVGRPPAPRPHGARAAATSSADDGRAGLDEVAATIRQVVRL